MKVWFGSAFPKERGWPRVAIILSVLLHALLFLGPIESRSPDLPEPPARSIVLVPPPPDQADDSFIFVLPRRNPSQRLEPTTPVPGTPATPRPRPAPADQFAPLTPRLAQPRIDSGPAPRRGYGRVSPDYGNGVLWVRPVPVNPGEIARRLEEEHFEHVDSAVNAIMQAFLDSLALEPGAADARLPEWTTNVAGSKFGLDSRFIYIAGLKIPAAVLALLPLPQGNIDQAKAYNHLMDLRADIERAARRAENMDEFKRVIQEIRERKQRERDFQRAQREAPPPPPPDPPTP